MTALGSEGGGLVTSMVHKRVEKPSFDSLRKATLSKLHGIRYSDIRVAAGRLWSRVGLKGFCISAPQIGNIPRPSSEKTILCALSVRIFMRAVFNVMILEKSVSIDVCEFKKNYDFATVRL